MRKFFFFAIILLSLLFTCGKPGSKKSGRIKQSGFTIQTSKEKYDPSSFQISCDSLKYEVFKQGAKARFLIFNGYKVLDTITEEIVIKDKDFEKEFIKMDINFDGFCDLVIPDKNAIKNKGILHYYYVFDNETRQFVQNKTLPAYIGGLKLDIKNQRLKLYCPDQECFAYYKFTLDKKFEKVQGEFKP